MGMTTDELDAIMALHAASTQGKLTSISGELFHRDSSGEDTFVAKCISYKDRISPETHLSTPYYKLKRSEAIANGHFFSAAHAVVPKLVEEVRRLRDTLKSIDQYIGHYYDSPTGFTVSCRLCGGEMEHFDDCPVMCIRQALGEE